MPSGSGWRPSEGAKDALSGADVGGPRERPRGPRGEPLWARREPMRGVWIKAASPWRI